MTPHKHKDLIIAWANGAVIQYKDTTVWRTVDHPSWSSLGEYRIKPKTLKYRSCLLHYDYFSFKHVVHTCSFAEQEQEPREKWDSFVRWIDADWREVEVP